MKKIFTKNNIKSGVKTLSFFLAFVILLVGLSASFFSKSGAVSYKNALSRAYSFLSEPKNTVDVAAIGSSNLYSAFVPMQLYEKYGYTSTVISSPHQTVSKSYGFLQELLKCQKPKILIIETDMFYEDAPKFDKDKSQNNQSEIYKVRATAFFNNFTPKRFGDLVESCFSIFTFHDKWKQFSLLDEKPQNSSKFITCDHGYNFNDSVVAAPVNKNMEESRIIEPIPDEAVIYLDKMVNLCKERGIKVLLVEVPSQYSWNYYRHNAVSEYAKKNNLEFIDFNLLTREINLSVSNDFRDGGNHMNYAGATKVTSYLSDYLFENCSNILTDRRNDPDFSFWDESNKEFRKRYKVK